jgi:hypothetical protein
MPYKCYLTGVTVTPEEHEAVLNDLADMSIGEVEAYTVMLNLEHLIDAAQYPDSFGPEGEVVLSMQVHEQALDKLFFSNRLPDHAEVA